MALGAIAGFLVPNDRLHSMPMFSPAAPSSFTCLTFQCQFMGQLGFSLTGDGPVIVHRLLATSRGHGQLAEGEILSSQGPNLDMLLAQSRLKPTAGDVIVSVDGIVVTHLNTEELTRYIRHRKEFLSVQFGGTDLTPMTIILRRHYVEELHNLPSVVETDTNLYPVAEFEIMHPVEAMAAVMAQEETDPALNKSEAPAYDPVRQWALPPRGLETAGGEFLADQQSLSLPQEPVVTQPNGADAYGMISILYALNNQF